MQSQDGEGVVMAGGEETFQGVGHGFGCVEMNAGGRTYSGLPESDAPFLLERDGSGACIKDTYIGYYFIIG
jgi:hypothetical protein